MTRKRTSATWLKTRQMVKSKLLRYVINARRQARIERNKKVKFRWPSLVVHLKQTRVMVKIQIFFTVVFNSIQTKCLVMTAQNRSMDTLKAQRSDKLHHPRIYRHKNKTKQPPSLIKRQLRKNRQQNQLLIVLSVNKAVEGLVFYSWTRCQAVPVKVQIRPRNSNHIRVNLKRWKRMFANRSPMSWIWYLMYLKAKSFSRKRPKAQLYLIRVLVNYSRIWKSA